MSPTGSEAVLFVIPGASAVSAAVFFDEVSSGSTHISQSIHVIVNLNINNKSTPDPRNIRSPLRYMFHDREQVKSVCALKNEFVLFCYPMREARNTVR